MSQPTADLELHEEQLKINNAQMEGLLKTIFPDLDVPYGDIYLTLQYLEETHINASIIPKVIRGMQNILIGTGKGEVVIHVHEEVSNVSVNERDKDQPTKLGDKESLEQK